MLGINDSLGRTVPPWALLMHNNMKSAGWKSRACPAKV